MSRTTIQLDTDTRQRLKTKVDESGYKSYDDYIRGEVLDTDSERPRLTLHPNVARLFRDYLEITEDEIGESIDPDGFVLRLLQIQARRLVNCKRFEVERHELPK